jgi:hypothetical protein
MAMGGSPVQQSALSGLLSGPRKVEQHGMRFDGIVAGLCGQRQNKMAKKRRILCASEQASH